MPPDPVTSPPEPWLSGVDASAPEFSPWDAYGHWKRWMDRHLEGALPESADSFMEGLDSVHEANLYNLMARLANADPSLTAVPLEEKPRA